MEEMRKAAMAYYENMSSDQKQLFESFYGSIDVNEDGRVSTKEFLKFVKEKGYNRQVPPNLFGLLDNDTDGTLDFEECFTFFYMIRGQRLVTCEGCGTYLWGLYFLCAECYHVSPAKLYDLCCSCYRNRNFNHIHSPASFLDNYALLRTLQFESNAPGLVDGTRSSSGNAPGLVDGTRSSSGLGTLLVENIMSGWESWDTSEVFNENCSQQ